MAEAEERSGGILKDLPLYGVPVGVKDIIATRGIPTRMGSRIFANHVPGRSAGLVRRLEALGGIVMGKTVTTEFAFRHPGKTRNPWNLAHTPGGSSSGSAAAVAAGFVPVAIGTQTLGSVIRPAAFCGVVGYKPSFGAISRDGVFPFSKTLDHVGVFARSRRGRGLVRRLPDGAWTRATRPPGSAPACARSSVPLASARPCAAPGGGEDAEVVARLGGAAGQFRRGRGQPQGRRRPGARGAAAAGLQRGVERGGRHHGLRRGARLRLAGIAPPAADVRRRSPSSSIAASASRRSSTRRTSRAATSTAAGWTGSTTAATRSPRFPRRARRPQGIANTGDADVLLAVDDGRAPGDHHAFGARAARPAAGPAGRRALPRGRAGAAGRGLVRGGAGREDGARRATDGEPRATVLTTSRSSAA